MRNLTKDTRVLFIPMIVAKLVWNKRYYMLGKVTGVVGNFVYVRDVCGQEHVEYIDKVIVI